MDEHVYSTRALKDYAKRAEEQKAKNLQGHYAENAGKGYTPQAHQALSNAPTITATRSALQNTAGQFLLKPADDGTLTAGTFGFDEWGRMVAI